MRSLRFLLIICLFYLPFTISEAFAAIDVDAAVVKLRTSCQEAGVTLNNCFTAMSDLEGWITSVRTPKPTSSAPLSVDIGPGVFGNLALNCGGTWGYTTFRGAGRKNTTIGAFGVYAYSLDLKGCTSMAFEDMAIGPLSTGGFGGINWQGTGTSSWQDVDLFSTQTYGWQDVTWDCPTNVRGAHYWFNSRIVSTSNQGAARPYRSTCSEDWFFGSEITINPSYSVNDAFVLKTTSARAEIHFYGGVLRLILGTGITAPAFDGIAQKGAAIAAALGGNIHIHGTGIDILSTPGNPVTALGAVNGGVIHANESAYNVSTGAGGSFTRISNNGGHIHAPYLWEHIPSAPNFTSVSGADMTTITNTSDNHQHLVIYDNSCTSKWFDTTANACM